MFELRFLGLKDCKIGLEKKGTLAINRILLIVFGQKCLVRGRG